MEHCLPWRTRHVSRLRGELRNQNREALPRHRETAFATAAAASPQDASAGGSSLWFDITCDITRRNQCRCRKPEIQTSLLGEVVEIDAFDPVGRDVGDADAIVDHEIGQLFAIDQNDALFDPCHVLLRFFREQRRGEEDALARPLAVQAAGEPLHDRPTDNVRPPLGLNIDEVEAEPILLDAAVDPVIAAAPERLEDVAM